MDDVDSQPHRNGHPVNWTAEFHAHRHWLQTVIYARLGHSHAVEDVLQEVLLAAVEEKSPIQSPSGWLYRLAVRKSLLYRRKLGRERRRLDRYSRQQVSSKTQTSNTDPINWLLAGERAELIRKALARLNNRERELLLLKYTEDWSYQQMAEHLDLTPGAVESRLHRARLHLREQLAALHVID